MKKMALLLVGMAALLALTTPVSAATRTADARQHPIDHSGIHSRITFVDTGTSLTVHGVARGLDPTKVYFSLIYDTGSVPGGPNACEETNDSLTETQMFVGVWDSKAQTLSATKTGPSYAALGTFRTVSIRQVKDPSKPISEENQFLVACGEVHINHR